MLLEEIQYVGNIPLIFEDETAFIEAIYVSKQLSRFPALQQRHNCDNFTTSGYYGKQWICGISQIVREKVFYGDVKCHRVQKRGNLGREGVESTPLFSNRREFANEC